MTPNGGRSYQGKEDWNDQMKKSKILENFAISSDIIDNKSKFKSKATWPKIKVWCQFLQNVTSMLFFFQMNTVLTYLSIWKDSWIIHLCWSVRYFHGVKWGIRCFIKIAQLSYIAYYASDQFMTENKHPLKSNFRRG